MTTILEYIRQAALDSIILVGDYGSGKTEVAVNLALHLASSELARPLAIADLDLVNPYFRCREAAGPLEEAGVRVVMPAGSHRFADLPILLPEIKGLLQNRETFAVLDVGGDEAGSRVLAALAPAFDRARHGFWLVVNARRPFNDTVEGCLDTLRGIEDVTGMRATGLVANTHLMNETTTQMVVDGAALARAVGEARSIPVVMVTAVAEVARELDGAPIDAPLLVITRQLVPPWSRPASPTPAGEVRTCPASR